MKFILLGGAHKSNPGTPRMGFGPRRHWHFYPSRKTLLVHQGEIFDLLLLHKADGKVSILPEALRLLTRLDLLVPTGPDPQDLVNLTRSCCPFGPYIFDNISTKM